MYQLSKNSRGIENAVIRLTDMTCISFNPDNTDYQAFLLWKSEGNKPLPADE
jgi:hypothetical protein